MIKRPYPAPSAGGISTGVAAILVLTMTAAISLTGYSQLGTEDLPGVDSLHAAASLAGQASKAGRSRDHLKFYWPEY
ncbi:MAG: hypothetical protein QGG74_00825 [Phycisphaerales bacterium]|nr:hypothetical protein [Phycisphaerales bacterium]